MMTIEEALKYWDIQLECTEYMLEEPWCGNVSIDEYNAHIEFIDAMKCAVEALEVYFASHKATQSGRLIDAEVAHSMLLKGYDISDVPTVKAESSQWISCSDRLPEDHEIVLAVIDKEVREVSYSNGGFQGKNFYRCVSHVPMWMPLPKAPEAKST